MKRRDDPTTTGAPPRVPFAAGALGATGLLAFAGAVTLVTASAMMGPRLVGGAPEPADAVTAVERITPFQDDTTSPSAARRELETGDLVGVAGGEPLPGSRGAVAGVDPELPPGSPETALPPCATPEVRVEVRVETKSDPEGASRVSPPRPDWAAPTFERAGRAEIASPSTPTPRARATAEAEAWSPPSSGLSAAFDKLSRGFNRDAARAAAAPAAAAATGCKRAGGPTGTARVVLTFAPSGRASQVEVADPVFAGTPVGSCVASRFRGVTVPPFEGAPVTVAKLVTLR